MTNAQITIADVIDSKQKNKIFSARLPVVTAVVVNNTKSKY
jgi:hypothetical protein